MTTFKYPVSTNKNASPRAVELAEALVEVMCTHDELRKAQSDVPEYTGNLAPCDYFAEEEANYLDAASYLEYILMELAEVSTDDQPIFPYS